MWSVHSVYTRVSVSECSLLGRYQKNASRDVLLWPPVSSAGILSPVRVFRDTLDCPRDVGGRQDRAAVHAGPPARD